MPDQSPWDPELVTAETCAAADDLATALEAAERLAGNWAATSQTDELVHPALQRCLLRLAQTDCWGPSNRAASNLLWQRVGHWLSRGWLQNQARVKPRGYAGDFELLGRIDRQVISEDPLGRSFDTFFQNQAAAQAVRNRHQWLRREMVAMRRRRTAETLHYVSVGCGPACDMSAAVADLTPAERTRTRVTLLDLDPAAIEFASGELARLLPGDQVQAVRENLFRLARVPRKAAILRGADFISCPGLFDYLSEEDAAALLGTFWEHLAPGGRLLVFNFAPRHPSQAYMEWIGNWYLTYRDVAEMQRLAERSGIPRRDVRLASESIATDHGLIADKPAH